MISFTRSPWPVCSSEAHPAERLQVLSTGPRSAQTQAYVLCMPVNITLVCLILMQCCSVHVVAGGAGHVWFMWRVQRLPTRRPSVFLPASYTSEWGLWIPTFSLVQERWQTDLQLQECVCWFDGGWKLHTCFSLLPWCRPCTQPHLEILLFFCAMQLYTCKVLVECLTEVFYYFVLCMWKMFDILEHANIIITSVRRGKPDSEVTLTAYRKYSKLLTSALLSSFCF